MIKEALHKYFGFNIFRQGQQEVIENILKGQSAGAVFPTGAGKSLCYQLPAMLLPGMTMVVSPLLSLMKDQIDFLKDRGIPAARLDSTLPREEALAVLGRAKRGELKILMIAVERFKNERFRSHLENMTVSLMVVDEAHCISEWGHNFRPEYLKLPHYQKQYRIPQVLLLTATATEEVIRDMGSKLEVPRNNVTVTGFYRKNLFLQVTPAAEPEKNSTLLARISEAPNIPTIVYVTQQKTAEAAAGLLASQGISASAYHAGLKNDEREEIQNRFMQGSLACVVATIAFGMGIDKKDIRRVIHYDLPRSIENYSQEIGRSGRDGQEALCEILASLDNLPVLENFIYGDTPDQMAIIKVLEEIRRNEGFLWEVKLAALSRKVNIRLLPLTTLLVYLDMEGIIRPKLTYFESYFFKFMVGQEEIIKPFHGERKEFVKTVLAHCETKKVWTYADMPGILQASGAERQRVISALEYFDEKGWIRLQSQKAVEVYDILTQGFDGHELSGKMAHLFQEKENHEIGRIRDMTNFFESRECLSKGLAAYFGQTLELKACGHCSVCRRGPAVLKHTRKRAKLLDPNFLGYAREFFTAAGEKPNSRDITKFLCGIHTPIFSAINAKSLPNFGVLDGYPFQEVAAYVQKNCGQFLQHPADLDKSRQHFNAEQGSEKSK